MDIIEYSIKVFLYRDLKLEETGYELGRFLNELLCTKKEWINQHYNKSYKPYSFNYLYPLAVDNIYSGGKIYNFQCRINSKFIEQVFDESLEDFKNGLFKAIVFTKKVIPQNRIIQRVFTTTPLIIKNDTGYWQNALDYNEFEDRIRNNMIKKFNFISDEDIKEAKIFTSMTLDNRSPIAIKYKDIRLLGDKITLYLSADELSQKIAYNSLAFGLGENNATAGTGFIHYKYEEMR